MALTALLVGALVLVGVARLGWIAELLSTPVITGVLAGIAIEIVVRQIPVLLGVGTGATTTIDAHPSDGRRLGQVNPWTLGVAIGVLAVIVMAQPISHRLPGPLFGAGAVHPRCGRAQPGHASRCRRHRPVHGDSSAFSLPLSAWSDVTSCSPTVLTVAFLCVAQTAATVRASRAPTAPSPSDFNRDLVGVGAGSIAAGLVGAFAVDASPPNTAVTTASGARSQLTNTMAAVVVLGRRVLRLPPRSRTCPRPPLQRHSVSRDQAFLRFGELRAILRFDRIEFFWPAPHCWSWRLSGSSRGCWSQWCSRSPTEPGDLPATRHCPRPRAGTDHWIPRDIGRKTERCLGFSCISSYAPLWYGNADYVALADQELVNRAPAPVHAVIVDANAIADIDYTGLQTLRGLIAELAQRKIVVGIARASHLVHHDLKHGSVLNLLGVDHLYASVAEAVAALSPPHAKP